MKIVYFLCSLVPCFVSVSCVTQGLTDHRVNDAYAWLDTPPRSHLRDTRPQSTLTQWKTALPPARERGSAVSIPQVNRASVEQREDVGRSRQNYNFHGSTQDNRTSYRGNGGNARRHYQHHDGRGVPQRQGRQGYVRTVEKVGPSIVPQLSAPLSTRSYSGGPRILPATGPPIVPVPTPQVRREVDARAHYDRSHRDRRRR